MKRIISLLIVAVMMFSLVSNYSYAAGGLLPNIVTKVEPGSIGDADCNGDINLSDASVMLKYIAGWELTGKRFEPVAADIIKDGKVNLSDVSQLLKFIVGYGIYDTTLGE